MPRARKTQSGAKAQPVQAIRGQEYGQGVRQEALQRSMPAPATNTAPNINATNTRSTQTVPQDSTQGQETAQPQVEQQNQPPRMDFAALRSAIEGSGGLLNRPDDRPDVPFTATLNDPTARFRVGLSTPTNRMGDMMRELSRRTGDSLFADLAAKAGL